MKAISKIIKGIKAQFKAEPDTDVYWQLEDKNRGYLQIDKKTYTEEASQATKFYTREEAERIQSILPELMLVSVFDATKNKR